MSPRSQAGVARDLWLTPRGIGHVPDTPWRSGRPRGPSDSSASCPGHLVDPAGPRTRARVAKDIGSTSRALGQERVLPGTAGQACGDSDPSVSRQGQLVEQAGYQTRVRVALDNWWMWLGFGHGLSPLGQLVKTAGPQT